MLKKWELTRQPAEKDSSRWRLKVKISEEELEKFLASLPGNKGRPFIVEDGVFDFGVYFYTLSESDHAALAAALRGASSDGKCEDYNAASADIFEELARKLDASSAAPAPRDEQPHSPPAASPPPAAAPAPAPSPNGGFLVEDIPLNSEYVFEQFVVGPNNRFTHAAALAVAKAPGKTYNPFFIHGGVGLGKTHLMQSIGHYVKGNLPDLKVLYITTEKFVADVVDAIGHGEAAALRNFYKSVDVLLVDDIQSLSQSESTQDEFFNIFNLLHQNKKQIVITCDRPPKLLTVLEDRLRSRFEWGLIADIKSPSIETRVAILKKKEETEHLDLDDNILLYIASKLKSNIRELEGFLKRITAYSTLTKQEVDITLVKKLMAELLPGEDNPDITMAQEIEEQHQAAARAAAAVERPPEKPAAYTSAAPVAVAPPPRPAAPPRPAPPPRPPSPPQMSGSLDSSLRPVDVVFFYPSGRENELTKIKEKFAEVIKKHKLKFQLVSVFDKPYETKSKINYAMFTQLCKTNKVNISVVLSPPPEEGVKEDEFSNVLGAMMSDEKISLQLVPWNEINKDYRYLNLALDITLSSTTGGGK